MKRQKLQLIILLIVLVALAACLFGIKQYNQAQTERQAEPEGDILIDADAEAVISITFDNGEESIHLEKVEDVWYNAADHSQAIKQNRPGVLLTGVTPLVAQVTIENVTDLGQYGLKEPSRTIAFETENESYIIYVGDRNEMTDTYYVSLPSDPNVYAVDAAAVTRFNATWDSLLDTSEEK